VCSMMASLFNAILWNNSINQQSDNMWKLIDVWKKECFPSLKDSDNKDVKLTIDDLFVEGSEYLLESFLWISSRLLGVKWTNTVWDDRQKFSFFKRYVPPFSDQYIQCVQPRVLELNMAYHSHGVVSAERVNRMLKKAEFENSTLILSETGGEDRKRNLIELSIAEAEKIIYFFEEAVDRQPTNEQSLIRLSRAYALLEDLLKKQNPKDEQTQKRIQKLSMKRDYLIRLANGEFLIKMGCKAPDPSGDTVFALGLLLMEKNRGDSLKQAEEKFLEASRKGNRHSKTMLAALRFFWFHCPLDEVLQPLERVDGTDGTSLGFHAFVFHVLKHDWKQAAEIAKNILSSERFDSDVDEYVYQFISTFRKKLDVYIREQ